MKETVNEDFVPKIFYCGFRKCEPEWRLHQHSVENYDITYIVKGGASYTIDGKTYELGAGDLVFLSEGSERQAFTYPKNLMHCYFVNFNGLYNASYALKHHNYVPPPPLPSN
jgi:ethanolamine utilization protein EutQ (cupin superfamily)